MELISTKTNHPVSDFIKQIDDEETRADAITLDTLMQKITGEKPIMWGPRAIGYGSYTFTRADKKNFETFAIGFYPRNKTLTIYIMPDFISMSDQIPFLGKVTTSNTCIYLRRLADTNLEVIEYMLTKGCNAVNGKHIDYKNLTKGKKKQSK